MQDFYDNSLIEKNKIHPYIMQTVNNQKLFAGINDITVTMLEEGCAEGELTITERSLNPMGLVHGGCLSTLADTVAGAAAFSRGVICVTLSSSMNYLAPAIGTKKIRCVATPQKAGKTVCVYDCRLTNDQGQTVATGALTFYVVRAITQADKDKGIHIAESSR